MKVSPWNHQGAYRVAAVALLAVLLAGVLLVPAAGAQDTGSPSLTVLARALNMRSGPGTDYPVIGGLKQGANVPIVGRHSASGWWQIVLAGEKTGWVSGSPSLVEVNGTTDKIPEVAAPAAPARAATTGAAPGSGKTIVFQESSGGWIYVISSNGSGLRKLTTGMDPALSPDGSMVAFTRWSSSGDGSTGSLWVINVDGSGERRISGSLRQPKSPTWSPDGTQIAVNQQHGGTVESEAVPVALYPPTYPVVLYDCTWTIQTPEGPQEMRGPCYNLAADPWWSLRVVNVGDGASRDLPSDVHTFSPTWNPANDWQVLYKGATGLQSMDVKRDANWAVTTDTSDRSPVFSPDGTKVALAYQQHDHLEIHTMNPDGSGRVRLTETPLSVAVEAQLKGRSAHQWNNASPAWSPDGKQIAFVTDRTGKWEIWVMNADGSSQRPLFSASALKGINLQYDKVDERVISWR
jgi:uncharacterized protein YgiM (DUF1202 family)